MDSAELTPGTAIVRTFDRLFELDWRSLAFRSAPVPGKDFRSYTWSCGLHLDQGSEGACVGFGCTHELVARPVVVDLGGMANATEFARTVYRAAQKVDPWEGENYEGTSVLAGMKTLRERGYISEYRWCLTMDDLLFTVGYRGPVVIGVDWYSGMHNPDSKGFIYPTGSLSGGHCLLVNGVKIVWKTEKVVVDGEETTRTVNPREVDYKKSYFRLHNSWGKDWGINGECFLSVFDMELLMRANGDFAIPTIRHSVPKPLAA